MTLRARLTLALGAFVAVAMILAGALVVGLTRASLVDRLDTDLRSAGPRDIRPNAPFDPADPTGRRIAFLLVDRQGELIDAIPSGFALDPDPLPSVPGAVDLVAAAQVGTIVERPAIDGSLRYRTLVERGPGGTWLVLAAPMTAVDEPIGVLVRNLVLIGGGVLAAVLVLGWVTIRRELRPLETIAVTADTIAAGDLSQRVALPSDSTEVGRLGAAFDSMLDRIESSFEEERQARLAREESERRLRQFVADASHELRTPLTAVRGYAELYGDGGLGDPVELERAMTRIGTESRRMGTLVEDLLLLARLDQGRPLRRELVDLSALCLDAVHDARTLEPEGPIGSTVAPGVAVLGDEDRLRQVVANLLANVRVHTPAGTPAHVALAVVGEGGGGGIDGGVGIDGAVGGSRLAQLIVADQGPGIDPAHATRVFDRFYRADPGRSRDRGGSGLGLSIVASIVAAHGGSVEYRPTVGGGASFVVTLPLAPPVS